MSIFLVFYVHCLVSSQCYFILDVFSQTSPPTLVRPMCDVTAALGATAVFTCTVCGRPSPEITWSGPDHVTNDGHVTITRDENAEVVTLEVRTELVHGTSHCCKVEKTELNLGQE